MTPDDERDTIARAAAALDDPGVTREAAQRAVDPLREALVDYDAAAEIEGCCGDGYCLVKREPGQHTNGGCKCPRDPWKAQRMMAHGQRLADAARAALAEIDRLSAALAEAEDHGAAQMRERAAQAVIDAPDCSRLEAVFAITALPLRDPGAAQ